MTFSSTGSSDVTAGEVMLAEMSEQPSRVSAALSRAAGQSDELAGAVDDAGAVVFVGRGSSRAAGMYGATALRRLTGKAAFLVSPTELGWADAAVSRRGRRLIVAISQSGESQEVVSAVEREIEAGSRIVVVTNAGSSRLAELARSSAGGLVMDCLAGEERAVPATKSFTTTLACLLAVASAGRSEALAAAAVELPELMDAVLTAPTGQLDLSECRSFAVVGEGYAEAVAEEGAIKLRETLRLPVSSHEASEFLHGNVNAVGPGTAVIGVAADRLGFQLAASALDEAARRGARTLLVAPGVSLTSTVVSLPEAAPEWVPFLAVLPIQQAALRASLAVGLNPDAPDGLSKVTRVFDTSAAQ
jgi:glutamine---fructose-6-phosphate transaminase (isomerizing)